MERPIQICSRVLMDFSFHEAIKPWISKDSHSLQSLEMLPLIAVCYDIFTILWSCHQEKQSIDLYSKTCGIVAPLKRVGMSILVDQEVPKPITILWLNQ